jgi:hypothetical protein
MKTIELKTGEETKIGMDGNPVSISFKTSDFIFACLDVTPRAGFTLKDLIARRRVQDALDRVLDQGLTLVSLEDHDFDTLKDCAFSAQWQMRSKFLEDFLSNFV